MICCYSAAERVEVLADQVMSGEETLCLPRRLEPLQLSFSSSRRLVRVLGSIVEIAALPVLNTLEGLLPRRGIARQLVGNDRPQHEAQLLQQLTEEPLDDSHPLCAGCPGVAAALNEDTEDHLDPVHRAPEIVPDATDPDEHLIQVPPVSRPAHPRHHRLLI